jgi:hypothetical protein
MSNGTPPPVLLLHAEDFTDATGRHTLVTALDVTIDPTVAEFGSSFNFTAQGLIDIHDGTATYTDFVFGTGDFTIDFWMLANTDNDYARIFDSHASYSAPDGCYSLELNANVLNWTVFGVGAILTATIPLSQWVHIACVRASGNFVIYVNGIAAGSIADTNDYTCEADHPRFGADGYDGGERYDGWLDEIRFLNGYAAWTSNFTPQNYPYGGTPPAPPMNVVFGGGGKPKNRQYQAFRRG